MIGLRYNHKILMLLSKSCSSFIINQVTRTTPLSTWQLLLLAHFDSYMYVDQSMSYWFYSHTTRAVVYFPCCAIHSVLWCIHQVLWHTIIAKAQSQCCSIQSLLCAIQPELWCTFRAVPYTQCWGVYTKCYGTQSLLRHSLSVVVYNHSYVPYN